MSMVDIDGQTRDPWLSLPLAGVHLVEASAGTGKTFTLATLVTRLVVERDLRLAQILTVTFTEAATQELRKRIRARLQLALDLVANEVAGDDSPEVALTRALLANHLASSGESSEALRHRLRRAVDESDLAAIFTIHGFCARVLREHALESGQTFDPPELLAHDRELRDEVATDLWRAHARDPDTVDDLLALWKQGPQELAADLSSLVREPVLLPPAAPLPADPTPQLAMAADALLLAIEQHSDDAMALIEEAFQQKIFDGRRARRPSFEKAFAELRAGRAARYWPRDDKKLHLEKLLPERLLGFCKEDMQDKVPRSPLFDALADWCAADDAMQDYRARRRARLLHRLRDEARTQLLRTKRRRRVQTYDDLIDEVSDALQGEQGQLLARRLREQYRIALVDEFQDTDLRQWRIFEQVFGPASDEPALFLIGDPKQAIYGFRGGDVHTYLAARASAMPTPALSHNFRSRPSLLAAIAALYEQAGNAAFVDDRIHFQPIQAGDKRVDGDYQRDGQIAPALTLWQAPVPTDLDARGNPKPWNADRSRELATAACVAAIHRAISDGRAGRALINGRPLRPGDIAVLVRSHNEATRIQRALAEVGIAAVAAGKQSLFETSEARELHTLLLSLLHGADDGRLRAALATVLVGEDAAAVAALDRDSDVSAADADSSARHRHWQQQAMGWRERLQRGGPLALVNELCAAQAPRLLALADGERRISNFLQLAELLQHAQARALGLQGLVDWLGRRIASADRNDETQLLRLESDAQRVQIITLHKSKGLEYPLVFLPFVGIGRKPGSPGRHCVAHDHDDGRRLHWKLDLPEAGWSDAERIWRQEQQAEDARLLYVGLTRAEHALWLAHGSFYNQHGSPLQPLLGNVYALAARPEIYLDRQLPDDGLPRLPAESAARVPPARRATRLSSSDWWVYSFTQLANAEAGSDPSSAATVPPPGGGDEPGPASHGDDIDPVEAVFDPRFSGSRFGVALHAALEDADFSAWRDWQPGDSAPAAESALIEQALRQEGYAVDELTDGVALTTALVGQTLTVPLPEGVRLCDVAADDRRAEIEFQFALQPTRVDALLQLLHRHGLVLQRSGFGLRRRLQGLMTGLIDLTYRVDDRWYVLDYKSNRLARYDHPSLAAAMSDSEYDLQALIYTLALHRWLRFRLGTGYDYARDFGGIRYLFCRGLDAGRDDSPGIHAQRFSPELVEALDTLFGHAADEGLAA
ncbi:exodeoxyribonuclease V subunit beta [Pseudoxanthomonas dokdonensis]|uniref:RecBCD enzyme subunit RecB n=1 Tax=Pseudoxanthomonas dokdonensis TaxID=344882 RepID=A0A0R0CFB2_9GAMM|nr:exodeoxyribonuclease V subunit beta [Pseudoxanthomonas dokdonensis]KRG68477.1 exodeoxyribonuclease V subunit beta [Pseudoxanthomonas dokdonensis]